MVRQIEVSSPMSQMNRYHDNKTFTLEYSVSKSSINQYRFIKILHLFEIKEPICASYGFTVLSKHLADPDRYEHRVINVTNVKFDEEDELIEINKCDVKRLSKMELVQMLNELIKEENVVEVLVKRRVGDEIDDTDVNTNQIKTRSNRVNVSDTSINVEPSSTKADVSQRDEGILSREELELRSKTRFWRIARKVFHMSMLVIFFGMIVFLAIVIYLSPKCDAEPRLVWWQNGIMYKVDMNELKNFCNLANDDCVPFKRLTEHVNYFVDLKANAIWLSGIVNLNEGFTRLEQSYGDDDDFKELLDTFHSNNIKVIFDFSANFVNKDHEWFRLSKTNQKYFNYFVWTKVKNNWLNVNGVSAWSKMSQSDEYFYLHQYESNQPDLNYHNPEVYEYLLESISYWLDFGIDGFNMITISRLFEDQLLGDEVITSSNIMNKQTQNRRETFHLIAEIKQLINSHNYTKLNSSGNSKKDILLALDSHELLLSNNYDEDSSLLSKYYGTSQLNGLDLIGLPLNKSQGVENFIQNIKNNLAMTNKLSKASLWLVKESLNKAETILLWMLGSYLPSSTLIQLPFYQYSLFAYSTNITLSSSSTPSSLSANDVMKQLESVLKLRRDFKSSLIGFTQFVKNRNHDLIVFKRFINPEKNVLVIINLNNQAIKLDETINSELEQLNVRSRHVDIDFQLSLLNQTSHGEFKMFEFDKNGHLGSSGRLNVEIPPLSGYICSFLFVPPDLRDIL